MYVWKCGSVKISMKKFYSYSLYCIEKINWFNIYLVQFEFEIIKWLTYDALKINLEIKFQPL